MVLTTRLSLLTATFLTFLAAVEVRADDRFAGMDDYVLAAMHRWEVPGLAIAVVKDGDLVLARGYGVCEIGQDRRVTEDTVFPIASCSKSFTAACVAILVDEGKLRWDDPVISHLPEFELAEPYATEHATLRDMLCHRVGLPRAEPLSDRGDLGAMDLLRRIKFIEPVAELRTRFTYSNHMYVAAGEVVSRVSGQPWERFVTERILAPLEMRSTAFSIADVEPQRRALRHWNDDGKVVARPARSDSLGAAGAMHSSVVDMAQWLNLHLAGGTRDGRRLISEEAVREMHAMQFSIPVAAKPRNVYAAEFLGTGLGWMVLDYRGRKIVRHGGGWGAWTAMIPEADLGVVILSNLDLNGLSGMLMYDLLDAYLVGPELAWDRAKWPTWLEIEGPAYAYRPRDEAKAKLEAAREQGTKPSLPLDRYAGTYESNLYGQLLVRHESDRLAVTFGEFSTEMSHWQDDAFYVHAPTRLTYDWLLSFTIAADGAVSGATVKHVGWDVDERDQVFTRTAP